MSLKDIIKADLQKIYTTDGFGVLATLVKPDGARTSIIVIRGQEQDLSPLDAGQADIMPVTFPKSSAPEVERGYSIEIEGVYWRVESATADDFVWMVRLSSDRRLKI